MKYNGLLVVWLVLLCGIAHAEHDAGNTVDAAGYETLNRAFKKIKLQAKQGDASAQHTLGCYHLGGDGIAPDFQEAKKWFLLAAKQGYSKSQGLLGGVYLEEGDWVRAYAWLLIGTASGDPDANTLRAACIQHMTTDQLEDARKLAGKYKRNIFSK